MKLTIEETIRGMITGRYTHIESDHRKAKQICNYNNNYYGDRTCISR